MSELKEVIQAPITNLPSKQDEKKCQVVLSKGRRAGELCKERIWPPNTMCSAHTKAAERKYGSSNPFAKAFEVKQVEPFSIKDDEEEDDFEELPPELPLPLQEENNIELDDIEEITISLKNVKAICFKIVRAK